VSQWVVVALTEARRDSAVVSQWVEWPLMRQGAIVAVVSQWVAVALTEARRDSGCSEPVGGVALTVARGEGGCSEPVGGSGPNCGKAPWWM
jgi:hypothetical protein